MLNALTALTGKTSYRSRVDSDNYASQNIMREIGAKPNGISEVFIHGEDLQKFQVAPIDLIGHVLEFCIEWKAAS